MACCCPGSQYAVQRGRQVQVQPKHGHVGGSSSSQVGKGPREAANVSPVVAVPLDVEPPRRGVSIKPNNDVSYGEKEKEAAKHVQAVVRGQRDRHRVNDQYRSQMGKEIPARPEMLGFHHYAEENPRMPNVPDNLRFWIRDATARLLLLELGLAKEELVDCFEQLAFIALSRLGTDRTMLSPAVSKQMGLVRYFIDPVPSVEQPTQADKAFFQEPSGASTQGAVDGDGVEDQQDGHHRKKDLYLLGQFDCLAVVARADYDASFAPTQTARSKSIDDKVATATSPAIENGKKSTEAVLLPMLSSELNNEIETNAVEGTLLPHTAETPEKAKENALLDASVDVVGAEAQDCDGPDGLAGWFWVIHAAAPNIGESANADDFHAYSKEETPPMGGETQYGGSASSYRDPRGATNYRSTYNQHQSYQQSAQCCWKAVRTCRRLDEDLYLNHMGRLWRNVFLTMGRLNVTDAVVFPFGMGAFLRHLGQNDDQYNDARTMRALRRKVADQFIQALSEVCLGAPTPATGSTAPQGGKGSKKGKPLQPSGGSASSVKGPTKVHLCLVVSNPESVENHNSFLEAAAAQVEANPKLREVLQLRRNVDCLQLAHEISTRLWLKNTLPKVAILNGACRKLVGNHWFQSGARFAIDENLHRRSVSLARAALLLNLGAEPLPRKPLQLASHVVRWGGQVFRCDNGKKIFGEAEENTLEKSTIVGRSAGSGEGCCGCCSKRRRDVRQVAPAKHPDSTQHQASSTPHPPDKRHGSPNPPPTTKDKQHHTAKQAFVDPAPHGATSAPTIPVGGLHMGSRHPTAPVTSHAGHKGTVIKPGANVHSRQ